MMIAKCFYQLKTHIPCTRAYKVRLAAKKKIKDYRQTLNLLDKYDQGEKKLPQAVAGCKDLREYLRDL